MRKATAGAFLFAFLISISSIAETREFNLECKKAGGYYAWLNIHRVDQQIEIHANQGYAFELATQLKLSSKTLTKLTVVTPVSNCKFSDAESMLIECVANDIPLKFGGDESVDVTAKRFRISVSKVTEIQVDRTLESYRTIVEINLGDHQAIVEEVLDQDQAANEGCVSESKEQEQE